LCASSGRDNHCGAIQRCHPAPEGLVAGEARWDGSLSWARDAFVSGNASYSIQLSHQADGVVEEIGQYAWSGD
jgi:hypothetical protein